MGVGENGARVAPGLRDNFRRTYNANEMRTFLIGVVGSLWRPMLTQTHMSRRRKIGSLICACLVFVGGVGTLLGGEMVLFGIGAIMFAMHLPFSMLGDWIHGRRFKWAVGLRAIGFFATFAGTAFILAHVYTITPVGFWLILVVMPLVALALYVFGRLDQAE